MFPLQPKEWSFHKADYMKLTKDYLCSLYNKCNEKYFDGQLGKCDFSFFTKNISYLGWYNSKNDKNGKPKDKIWVGTSVKWTDEALERVLVHEMVHMYVYRIDGCKYDGLLGHGRRFRQQCKRIKKTYGIEILKLPKVEFIDKKNSPKLWERLFLWLFDW